MMPRSHLLTTLAATGKPHSAETIFAISFSVSPPEQRSTRRSPEAHKRRTKASARRAASSLT